MANGARAWTESHLSTPARRWGLGLTLVAIAIRIPFIGMAMASPDSIDYLARARAIVNGHDLPDPLRTPALPLLLALFEELGTEPFVSVVVLQNVIGMFLPLAVMLVGWRFFNRATGIIAGLLTAASPLVITTEQFALTDYLFGVGIFFAGALLAEAALRVRLGQPARRWLIGAGAAFGLATLVRGNGQYAVVVIPVVLLLAVRGWRIALRSAAVAIAAMIAVLAPWIIHNIISYDTPMVTTLGGEALYVRVIDHDRIPPPTDTANGRIARKVYNQMYAFAPLNQELPSGLRLAGVLENMGYSNVEASAIMMGIALEAIKQHPGLYLSNTWDLLGEYHKMYDPGSISAGAQIAQARTAFVTIGTEVAVRGRQDALPGDSGVTRFFWKIGEALSRFVYLFSFAGFLSLLLAFVGPAKTRVAAITFLTVVLLGFVVGAATEHFEPRYDLPYSSLTWLLMAAASVWVVQKLVAVSRIVFERALSTEVVSNLRYPEAHEPRQGQG